MQLLVGVGGVTSGVVVCGLVGSGAAFGVAFGSGVAGAAGAAGGYTSRVVCVAIPSPGVTREYYVRVDDDAANAECNETNNVVMVSVPCGPG